MVLLVLAAVFVGAVAQRVTGLGFALVVSPVLVILLGPFDGVLIVNLCGALSAGIILAGVRRDVEWRRYLLLAGPALVGIVPGALLAYLLPDAALEIGIGCLLVAALTTSLALRRTTRVVDGPGVMAGFGFASGVMNAAAGIGGPSLSVYAVVSQWEQRAFAATLQPFFLTIGGASLLTKLLIAPSRWPDLGTAAWVGIVVTMLAGIGAGTLLGPRIPTRGARAAVVVLAFAGAVTAIVKGVGGLV
ncbi:sulfite exporter TauE/SafE family protein [Clavibacter phaseoli]|nr:sulfite exporter TauE/SafE family protein [Clavibacter phaseoli]UKF32314.1 sulfite exporter TauE/SafE family protein [Clavibacter phaseoli]UKF38338.1 sulfite exporter TauE/SafE family protein [Clavibacter phaseoli]